MGTSPNPALPDSIALIRNAALLLQLTDMSGNPTRTMEYAPTSAVALALELHQLRGHSRTAGRFVHWVCECYADAVEITKTQWIQQLRRAETLRAAAEIDVAGKASALPVDPRMIRAYFDGDQLDGEIIDQLGDHQIYKLASDIMQLGACGPFQEALRAAVVGILQHKHKMVIERRSKNRKVIVFACEAHWCNAQIMITPGNLRQLTVKGQPWRNKFKKDGNYPLPQSATTPQEGPLS